MNTKFIKKVYSINDLEECITIEEANEIFKPLYNDLKYLLEMQVGRINKVGIPYDKDFNKDFFVYYANELKMDDPIILADRYFITKQGAEELFHLLYWKYLTEVLNHERFEAKLTQKCNDSVG